MKREPRNLPASIRARLKNHAQDTGQPFQEILVYYGIERFLFRLSKSDLTHSFVVKGGVLFVAWGLGGRRPTRDVDLLGYASLTVDDVEQIVKQICSLDVEPDGLNFDLPSINVGPIRAQNEHKGVRVRLYAYLQTTRIPLQIDIGYSNQIQPAPKDIIYPTLLNMAPPRLKGYAQETMIAEKFHAMVAWKDVNTRLKDFYDIWLLMRSVTINGLHLSQALISTFQIRETALPHLFPELFHDNMSSVQVRWGSFLKKINSSEPVPDFQSILRDIATFFDPVLMAISNDAEFRLKWDRIEKWK